MVHNIAKPGSLSLLALTRITRAITVEKKNRIFMIDLSLLSGTYMRMYIPIYLHDTLPEVPYPNTARYLRRTTAKLAPGLLRLEAFLRKLQLPKLYPSLVPPSARVPTAPLLPPLSLQLCLARFSRKSGGIGTRVLVFNDYCAQVGRHYQRSPSRTFAYLSTR